MLILRILLLTLGTLCTVCYLVLMRRGARYDPIVEGLPKEGFSDKELLAVGYALQELPLFALSGAVDRKLTHDAEILHPENEGRYVEYWKRLYWARTLSMTLLIAAFGFCAASWLNGPMMFGALAVTATGAYLFYDSGVNEMGNQLKKRSIACDEEFSTMVSKMALLMNCNLIFKDAWRLVAQSKEGELYTLMKEACAEMDSGMTVPEAVMWFARQSCSAEVTKFAAMVVQAVTGGGTDVTRLMRQQSREQWAHRRQILLQKGDAAAAKLLAPTMIVLMGVVVIIVTAAFSDMSFAF